jgi:hypothetical protein
MAKSWLKLLGALALLVTPAGLTFAQTGLPQTFQEPPSAVFAPGDAGAAVHKASGYAFPDHLGDMPRRKFHVYAADDVDANYTLRGGGNGDAWLDVYVYPAPRSLEEEAKNVEAELVKNVAAKPLASQPPLPSTAEGAVGK